MSPEEIILAIRRDEIDCNNSQSFFSKLVKALLINLTEEISIRNKPVPHVILNTGDDTMWLLEKEYDYSKEPQEVTNEQYIYMTKPRCVVTPGSIDTVPDQLTNPYSRGQFQFEYEDTLLTLSAEFRRIPIKVNIDLNYIFDSFTDLMGMLQQVVTKLAYIRTYKFVYMGQTIQATYKIPESFDGEHMAEMDGGTSDSKDRKLTMQLELESTLPVFNPQTVVDASKLITKTVSKLSTPVKNEINERYPQTRSGYRGFGSR